MFAFDLNLLKCLAALLDLKSVTLAAEKMAMSQPAMSRALAQLRGVLGDPLLVRTRGGMLLTRRAEDLLAPLQAWLAEAERLVAPAAFDPAALIRRFRIMADDHGASALALPGLAGPLAAAPGIAIDIVPPSANPVASLAAGDADLLISAAEPDRRLLHERYLGRERLVCAVRSGHKLASAARRGGVTIAALMDWPCVAIGAQDNDPLATTLNAHGLGRRIIAVTPYAGSALTLVARSDAVALLPASTQTGPGVECFAAPEAIGWRDIWLCWHNRGHGDPATQWLVERIAEGRDPAAEAPVPMLRAAE